jgi:hypothetical protein
MAAPFWITDPNVLFKKEYIAEVWPSINMRFSEKLNAITRLVLFLTLTGLFIGNKMQILITGAVTILCIVMLYFFKTKKSKEGFAGSQPAPVIDSSVHTMPSKKNPLMNVLPAEIIDNPTRKEAAPSFNKGVVSTIDNDVKDFVAENFGDPSIKDKLFHDLGDNFTFDRSMRQWYSTANTQIPNDQKSFAEWCYGDMVSCKEGHELACTRGAPHRWTSE